jgi:quercetin dioxygenase-like cupin family protein
MVDLSKLKQLNVELSDISSSPSKDTIEYMVDDGNCKGFNLFSSKEISIQRAFMEEGTNFPRHSHKEEEWLLQVSGDAKLTFYTNGKVEKVIKMTPGTMVEIPKKKSPSYKAKTNSWMVGIVIPGSLEYPGGINGR